MSKWKQRLNVQLSQMCLNAGRCRKRCDSNERTWKDRKRNNTGLLASHAKKHSTEHPHHVKMAQRGDGKDRAAVVRDGCNHSNTGTNQ